MRADKLAKMKMPSKPMAEQEAGMDMDMAMEDMPAEAEKEGEPLEQEMGEAGAGDMLADISDDDLMAEMKKRGLKMDEMGAAEAEDEDMEA